MTRSTATPADQEDAQGTSNIPRGKPKSGRVWKSTRTERHSAFKDKAVKSSWAKKVEVRSARKATKALENELKEERSRRKEELRKRQQENAQKRLENERKGEVTQVIKSTAKIKRMKKKQLRMLAKR